MQISISFLIIGIIQYMLLIIAFCMMIILKVCYSIRFSLADILISAIQVLNLTLLTHCVIKDEWFFLATHVNLKLLFIIQVALIFFLLIRFVRLYRKARARRLKLLTPQSIRETIDFLPGGICFSTPSGRPILTNHRMNELVYSLTKHTIINAQTTWEELRQFCSAQGCAKLEEPWINRDNMGGEAYDDMVFSLPDGNIWRFRQEELTDRIPYSVQLEATDISDLYRSSKKLYENNQRLAEQYERLQNLLENIVHINHEKEILSTKMRIHDELGRSIIVTKQHLANQTLSDNIPYLAETWENTIRNLEDVARIYADKDISPENELLRAAEMIGCHIDFCGERPSGRQAALLLYATVREALTNAVRHAQADRLNVTISHTGFGFHVEISDNGTVSVYSVTEGSGLNNLRRRLEQEGATLQVKCDGGVVLIADIPSDRKETPIQEGVRTA